MQHLRLLKTTPSLSPAPPASPGTDAAVALMSSTSQKPSFGNARLAWRQTEKGNSCQLSGPFPDFDKTGQNTQRIEEVAQRIAEVSGVDDTAQLQFSLRRHTIQGCMLEKSKFQFCTTADRISSAERFGCSQREEKAVSPAERRSPRWEPLSTLPINRAVS